MWSFLLSILSTLIILIFKERISIIIHMRRIVTWSFQYIYIFLLSKLTVTQLITNLNGKVPSKIGRNKIATLFLHPGVSSGIQSCVFCTGFVGLPYHQLPPVKEKQNKQTTNKQMFPPISNLGYPSCILLLEPTQFPKEMSQVMSNCRDLSGQEPEPLI